MSSIRDIIKLRNVPSVVEGAPVSLRRPSALDLLEALQFAEKQPQQMLAWFCYRHLLDEAGNPVFDSMEAALAADASVIMRAGQQIEALYGEGRD